MPEQISILLDREDALFLVSLVLNNAEYEDEEDEQYYRQIASEIRSQIPA
jgi:hypothetical protein